MTTSIRRGGSAGADGPPENPAETLPDADLVKEQLARILASSEFQGSERTRRFLRYVVEEALAGRAERIKAFSVAVAAFDRDESFNPQTDPIVRIEAARLRRCIERYYLVAGAQDKVRIGIPKGSYVPDFAWSPDGKTDGTPGGEAGIPPESPPGSSFQRLPLSPLRLVLASVVTLAAAFAVAIGFMLFNWSIETRSTVVEERAPQESRPSIAVLPFESSGLLPGQATFPSGMTNEIIRELSQYSGVVVLGPRSLLEGGDIPGIAALRQQSKAAFVLSGDVQNVGEEIRVTVQLTETETSSVIWAESYDRILDAASVFDLQAEIGREIVRKIAQPQGAIARFDWKRTRGMAPETWEAYDCVIQAEELRRRGELMPRSGEIRACLTQATVLTPGYAEPWIMLSLLEIDTLRYTPRTQILPANFNTALAAAQTGIDLAPDNGKAHMALMLTLFFRGDIERAIAVGDIALRLSPEDPDVVGEVGLRHVIGGNPDLGLRLLQKAGALYNDPPANLRVSLSLAYLRKGMIREAAREIDAVAPNSNFIYLAIATAIYGKAQRAYDSGQVAKELLNIYPGFPDWAARELAQRYNAPDLAATLIQGWQAAGLTIDLPAAKSLAP